MTDSGYTEQEIDALLSPFMAKAPRWPDENLSTAMQIGLLDGDVVELSERGTVMLETPRDEIDRRLAAILAKMREGSSPAEAVEAVVG